MKKILPLSILLFLVWNINSLKAQCYGTVKFDTSASAGASGGSPFVGNSTFKIRTSQCHELIMIAYNGWNGPGSGPVMVNGNPATFITNAINGNSGTAAVYAYLAGAAGTYNIVCTENGYNIGYYNNFAAAFYLTGTSNLFNIASLTTSSNTSACTTGGPITTNITTTIAGSMIFCSNEINEGQLASYPISYTGAIFIGNNHAEDGNEGASAYEPAAVPGTYTVTATNSSPPNNGCGGLAMVLVNIPPPVCGGGTMSAVLNIVQPTCIGNNGSIGLTVTGGYTPYTYVWTPNISTTANATGLSAGLYKVTVYSADDSCETLTDSIRLTGPSISMSSTDAKCVPTKSGTATITITNGKSPFTYAWSNGATTQTATGLTAGKYVVTVTDAGGCKSKDSINVVTYPAPTITAVPVYDSVCYGTGVIVTAFGGSSYSWLPVKGLSCNNCSSATAKPSVTTIYTVTGTDTNGCTNTASVTIKVIPVPNLVLTGRDTICIGSVTTLYASGANTYLWTPGNGGGTSFSVMPALTTTYSVAGTTDGCTTDTTIKVTVVPIPQAKIAASKDSVCIGDSLTLSGSGGTTYVWSPGNSTNAKIHINLLSATTYTLYAYGGNCMDSASISLKAIHPVSATISESTDSICPGESDTITVVGSGGSVRYRWDNGSTTTSIIVHDTITTIHRVVVYGTCDTMVEQETVIVVPLPAPAFNKGYHFECAGGQDTIVVSSVTNPTTYKWSNGQTGTYIIANINSDTVISVKAYNSLGCEVTDTFQIHEMSYPGVTLSYGKACGSSGAWIPIVATASGEGPYTYMWSNGHTSDTVNIHVTQDTTIVTLTLTNGCTITSVATLIKDNPQLTACCNTTILLGGDTTMIAGGNNMVSYAWTPPNSGLNCYSCPTVIATPTVTTTYTVTGVDSSGCSVERTVTIIVETPCYNFSVPNVFTPTNAGPLGLNNILYIPTHGFTSWSLLIFDRWGHEVYKSTDPGKYWDGNTESGSKAAEGVYYYVIDASCTGSSFQKNGFIQLIR